MDTLHTVLRSLRSGPNRRDHLDVFRNSRPRDRASRRRTTEKSAPGKPKANAGGSKRISIH